MRHQETSWGRCRTGWCLPRLSFMFHVAVAAPGFYNATSCAQILILIYHWHRQIIRRACVLVQRPELGSGFAAWALFWFSPWVKKLLSLSMIAMSGGNGLVQLFYLSHSHTWTMVMCCCLVQLFYLSHSHTQTMVLCCCWVIHGDDTRCHLIGHVWPTEHRKSCSVRVPWNRRLQTDGLSRGNFYDKLLFYSVISNYLSLYLLGLIKKTRTVLDTENWIYLLWISAVCKRRYWIYKERDGTVWAIV